MTSSLPDNRLRVVKTTMPHLIMVVAFIMLGFLAGAAAGRSARVGSASFSLGAMPLLICVAIGIVSFVVLYAAMRRRRWDISNDGMTIHSAGRPSARLRWDQIAELRQWYTGAIVRTHDGAQHRMFCVPGRDVQWLRATWKAQAGTGPSQIN